MVAISIALLGCAGAFVKQADLDAWKDVPVEALDTHSIFLTHPMIKTVTDSGVEIRVYSDKVGISSCAQNAFGQSNVNVAGSGYSGQGVSSQNFNAFQTCSSRVTGCDAVMYIQNRKAVEAKVVGQCYMNEKLRPEPGWERFVKKTP